MPDFKCTRAISEAGNVCPRVKFSADHQEKIDSF